MGIHVLHVTLFFFGRYSRKSAIPPVTLVTPQLERIGTVALDSCAVCPSDTPSQQGARRLQGRFARGSRRLASSPASPCSTSLSGSCAPCCYLCVAEGKTRPPGSASRLLAYSSLP